MSETLELSPASPVRIGSRIPATMSWPSGIIVRAGLWLSKISRSRASRLSRMPATSSAVMLSAPCWMPSTMPSLTSVPRSTHSSAFSASIRSPWMYDTSMLSRLPACSHPSMISSSGLSSMSSDASLALVCSSSATSITMDVTAGASCAAALSLRFCSVDSSITPSPSSDSPFSAIQSAMSKVVRSSLLSMLSISAYRSRSCATASSAFCASGSASA